MMNSMEVTDEASTFSIRKPMFEKFQSSIVKNTRWCNTIRKELYTRKGIQPMLFIDGCCPAYSDRFLGSSALRTLVRR